METTCPYYLSKAECASCQVSCTNCGTIPTHPAAVTLSFVRWLEDYVGSCHECGEILPLDSTGTCKACNTNYNKRAKPFSKVRLCKACMKSSRLICTQCKQATDIYAEGSTVCANCFYGDNFIPENFNSQVCRSCGQVAHLNSNHDCKNCFKEQNLYNSKTADSKAMRICPNCRDATEVGRKMCKKCEANRDKLKACRGCGTHFINYGGKIMNFCFQCSENIDRGNCTSCLNPVDEGDGINDRGWCEDCTKENEPR